MKALPKVQCLNSSASRNPCSHPRTKFKRVPTLGQERDCSQNTSTSPVPYPSRWIKQDHIKKQVFYQTHLLKFSESQIFVSPLPNQEKVSEPPVPEMPNNKPTPAQPTVPAEPENHQLQPLQLHPSLQLYQGSQQSKITRHVRIRHHSPNPTP